ncbi:MAG TPA: pyrroloquinoline quinone biosynthesis peptide chaperone PqqD [Verrucomicrobiae bacterium]|nr:pyrroloquinoline quinone biosynthesis peptide chaperone PqqD [Verrucomicrobiae bacterium]
MPPDETSCPQLARGVRLQTDAKTGDPILLFPEGVLYLSETAQEILCRCDGRKSIGNILDELAAEYEAEAETLRKDVLDCVLDLYQRKLVVV